MEGEVFITSGITEGEKIRLARLSKWLRQLDVASLANVSLCEVTSAEKNRWVEPERKERILKVLGLIDGEADDQ